MARGLDHVVHAVRDLDAAATLYRRLGFVVGARNRHPWGTHNHIVQLPGFFVEVLTMAEPEKLGRDGFSTLFGAFNRDFLTAGEGLSTLILESRDAAEDAELFRESGIAASGGMRFERTGQRPDGTPIEVAFSLAFARDQHPADAAFAVCQQHRPENFWNPAFQNHPNGVDGVAGVVLVADNPSDHHIFISAFAGERELLSTSTGIAVKTPRGEIQVMNPTAFRDHFGIEAPHTIAGLRLAAMRFSIRNRATLSRSLQSGSIAASTHRGRTVVGSDVAMGAILAFEDAAGR